MVMLTVLPEHDPDTALLRTSSFDAAAEYLGEHGIRLRARALVPGSIVDLAGPEIVARYAGFVDEICAAEGFAVVDCVNLQPTDDAEGRERAAAARRAFRFEHRHAEDEVRFFLDGRSCFYLHLAPVVLAVICEPGELLSVPAGTAHWFDMGPRPQLCAIRFFERPDGWVGEATGDPIAEHFPALPDLLADFGVARCG